VLGSQETPSMWTDPQVLQQPTVHLRYFKTRRQNLSQQVFGAVAGEAPVFFSLRTFTENNNNNNNIFN